MAYSQFTAYKALTKAALRSISKSPSSVIFTIAFPLIFILVFGYLGDKKLGSFTVAITQQDSANHEKWLHQAASIPTIEFSFFSDEVSIEKALERGKVNAGLKWIAEDSVQVVGVFQSKQEEDYLYRLLQIATAEPVVNNSGGPQFIKAEYSGRPYKAIDFILPGQLGFSLIAASIFGTAFVFFSLRQQLVLKRFFATPVKKYVILLAEGTARLVFQLVGAVLIIAIGYYFLDFTLINGLQTVVNLLVLSTLALLVFMSFGFVVSGIAKSESTIPPMANIMVLPQFLLAGTFFPIENFPGWLQVVAKILPLTYLNDAMRAVSFEGASLWDVSSQILVLILWGILGYGFAIKLFKWE